MKKLKRLGLRIDEDTKERLKKLADRNNISVSLYLRSLIKYADENDFQLKF